MLGVSDLRRRNLDPACTQAWRTDRNEQRLDGLNAACEVGEALPYEITTGERIEVGHGGRIAGAAQLSISRLRNAAISSRWLPTAQTARRSIDCA